MFNDLHIADDPTTVVLLGLIALFAGLPGIILAMWRISRPPLGAGSFRLLYLAWACVLAGASVWSFTRDPLLGADQVGANNFIRLGFLSVGVLLILLLGARYRFVFVRELGAGVLGVFSVFALWGLASTVWSVSPIGTLFKATEYCAMLALFALAASLISTSFTAPRHQLLALKSVFDWHWFLLFLMVMSVYVGVIVFPEYAILRSYRDQTGMLGFSLQGVLPGLSANAVGTLGAMTGIVAFVRILLKPGSRVFWAPLLLISVITMVLTQSRSPILGFVVAVGAVLLLNRRFGLLAMAGSLTGVALLSQQYIQPVVYEFMKRGQNEQNLASLTGRVPYWQAAFDAIIEKPLTGYGANVGGRHVLDAALGEAASTVHSSFVEVLLDTGVVGLVLLVGGLVMTWLMMFKIRPHVMNNPISSLLWFESLGVLTVLSVRSLFAVTLVWSWYVVNLGVVLVFVSVARRHVVRARHEGAAFAQLLSAAGRRRSSIRQ